MFTDGRTNRRQAHRFIPRTFRRGVKMTWKRRQARNNFMEMSESPSRKYECQVHGLFQFHGIMHIAFWATVFYMKNCHILTQFAFMALLAMTDNTYDITKLRYLSG